MSDTSIAVKGKAFNLKESVDYAGGSVVSKTLIKKDIGNITLFAFDAGQGLSEHTAPSPSHYPPQLSGSASFHR